jgi:cytochrome b involved in lipid metabolism
MAPNAMGLQVPNEIKDESSSTLSPRKEILYEGYYYDVTHFIQRHPGGNVIKFYTEPGEDGTLAIQQFHHRSIKQVLAMMKALPKRPAKDKVDHGKDPKMHSYLRILLNTF